MVLIFVGPCSLICGTQLAARSSSSSWVQGGEAATSDAKVKPQHAQGSTAMMDTWTHNVFSDVGKVRIMDTAGAQVKQEHAYMVEGTCMKQERVQQGSTVEMRELI